MTTEEIENLIQKLKSIKPNWWFKITGREDSETIISAVKLVIDVNRIEGVEEEFVIRNDYGAIMRKVDIQPISEYHKIPNLPEGVTMKKHKAKKNFVWEKQDEFWYEIFIDGKVVAVERA